MEHKVKALILAAGKGTRLRTEGCDIPKVMRLALGKPLLGHVLSALSFLPKEDIIIVVGYKKEEVMGAYPGYTFAEQSIQLGTGHAVLCAADAVGDAERGGGQDETGPIFGPFAGQCQQDILRPAAYVEAQDRPGGRQQTRNGIPGGRGRKFSHDYFPLFWISTSGMR